MLARVRASYRGLRGPGVVWKLSGSAEARRVLTLQMHTVLLSSHPSVAGQGSMLARMLSHSDGAAACLLQKTRETSQRA
jgi:hypothetical protein